MDGGETPHRLVLIVEDQKRDAELITELLQECGCKIAVDIAANAEEGLAKIQHSRVDLIICDYHLPGMNGLSFLKVVKKTKGNIPVLVLTGYPHHELEADFIRHGACTYLSKDADPRILVNVVKEVLAPFPARPT
ncbi:MAG TPA: response regulator [Nitrospira sp.]|nr:response regulator [Nitrospira sp.]